LCVNISLEEIKQIMKIGKIIVGKIEKIVGGDSHLDKDNNDLMDLCSSCMHSKQYALGIRLRVVLI
jgi:hypothetical protein